MSLRFTVPDFIDALEARRPWAQAIDDQNKAEHEKAEKVWLKDFRAECRRLAAADYAEAKDAISYGGRIDIGRPPSCPRSVVARLDRVLAVARQLRQNTVTVSQAGAWGEAWWLLTHDETITDDLCGGAS